MSTGNALPTFAYVYNPKSEPTSTLKVDTGYNFSENLFSKTTIWPFPYDLENNLNIYGLGIRKLDVFSPRRILVNIYSTIS